MSCTFFECISSKHRKIPGITFHKFPIDEARRSAWTKAVGRRNWTPKKSAVVCSKHFRDSDFDRCSTLKTILKTDAVPIPANEFSTYLAAASNKRQKLSPIPNEAEIINYPLFKVSEDIDTLQAISAVSLDTNSSEMFSSSVNNYKEYCMNLTDKAPTIVKANFVSEDNLPVTVSSHNTNSAQKVSHNGSCNLPIVSNNNVFLEKTKEISESVDISNAFQMKTNFSCQTFIQGRRIINFEYFLKALKKVNRHSKSGCNLNDIIVTNEVRSGLCTSFYLKCRVCNFRDLIWAERPDKLKNINTDTVAGMLSINCSFSDINKLLCRMDLPTLSNEVYVKKCSQILSDKIEGGTKIIDQNSNFTVIDDKFSKESGKSSESNLQIDAHQASTLPEKTSKNILNNHAKEQTSKSIADQVSASSDKNMSYEQLDFNGLLVKDEIEIEVSDPNSAVETDVTLPQDLELKASGDTLVVDKEQATLVTVEVKKEINPDVYYDELTGLETSEAKVLNNDSFLECADSARVMLTSQQKIVSAYGDNMVVDKEVVKLDLSIVKQEIQDDCDLCESVDMETAHKENKADFHNQHEVDIHLKGVVKSRLSKLIWTKLTSDKQKTQITRIYTNHHQVRRFQKVVIDPVPLELNID